MSHCLYDVWTDIGHGIDNTLSRLELEMVCERVGLCKIAGKVADEVYEKLALGSNCRISFNSFIALIQDVPPSTTTTTIQQQSSIEQHHQYEHLTGELTLSSSPIEIGMRLDGDDDTNVMLNSVASDQSYILMKNAISSASSHELHAISGLLFYF